MKAAVARVLQAVYLDGVARELLRGARRLARDARNRVSSPDSAIVASYFAAHPVPKLHLGCGPHFLDGWLNADQSAASANVLRFDVTQRFPLDDAAFDYVYSEHLIEHVPRAQGSFMLSECHRVLRPGGKVRISTPDLAFLLDLCRPDKSALQLDYVAWSLREWVQDAPHGSDALVINNFMRNWGHQFIYDEWTLRSHLERAGFAAIARCELGQSSDEALRGLQNEGRMPPGFLRLETMTLEATKPA
ncbi:MAG: methyltransferase domain-containing protein [Usitatibacter sp.]